MSDSKFGNRICSVVLPAGDPVRTLNVLETYVKPAAKAAGYEVLCEADFSYAQDSPKRTEIALHAPPMVVAYLGKEPWGQALLFQVGYRLATKLPLVLLWDQPPEGQEWRLPLQIAYKLPLPIPPKPSDEATVKTTISQIKRTIKMASDEVAPLDSNLALTVLDCPPDELHPDRVVYTHASVVAESIFGGKRRLVGTTLGQFVEDRRREMPAYQFKAFMNEQKAIASEAQFGTPIATVPMVFYRGARAGHAFLPVIVNDRRHRHVRQIEIVYLDVTAGVVFDRKEGCFRCKKLDPQPRPIQKVLDEAKVRMRPGSVFLSYNRKDQEKVREVHERLSKWGIEPFFDEDDIRAGDDFPVEIEDAIRDCRASLVFLGIHGLGPYQEKEIDLLLKRFGGRERIKPKRRIVPVLLEGASVADLPDGLEVIDAAIYAGISEDWFADFIEDVFAREEPKRAVCESTESGPSAQRQEASETADLLPAQPR